MCLHIDIAFRYAFICPSPPPVIPYSSGMDSETYLDQARCLAHITQVYHLQHRSLQTMMAALKQLNTVEEAQEDVHEVRSGAAGEADHTRTMKCYISMLRLC